MLEWHTIYIQGRKKSAWWYTVRNGIHSESEGKYSNGIPFGIWMGDLCSIVCVDWYLCITVCVEWCRFYNYHLCITIHTLSLSLSVRAIWVWHVIGVSLTINKYGIQQYNNVVETSMTTYFLILCTLHTANTLLNYNLD